ncbi:MAG: LysE family translocator [Proteobacteria bacterium]|nr:LysE family translocator [Pseudomonadota bacterium]
MSIELYLAYVLACVVIVVVPGPIVTLIVANALAHGLRAGLVNIAGAQAGLALMLAVVLIGLTSLIAIMGVWFDWLRLLGAAYLIWLGLKLLRAPALLADQVPAPPRGGFFLQGFLVLMTNPKALLLFGAFIPQFVDRNGAYGRQVVLLGLTFMVIAGAGDGAYALAFGRARALMSASRLRLVSRVSGAVLIAGGTWMALARGR